MRQLVKSFAFIIFIFNPLLTSSHDGEKHSMKGHSKADMMEQCVEPTIVMQKEHFKFLYHQRDKTVIKGVRTKKHSLANCIDCHVSYDNKGEAIPVNSDGQFCQTCHVETAVNIDCFSCHASVPRGKQVILKSNDHIKSISNIHANTSYLIKNLEDMQYEK